MIVHLASAPIACLLLAVAYGTTVPGPTAHCSVAHPPGMVTNIAAQWAAADSATAVPAALRWLAQLDSGQVSASLDSAAPLLRSMAGSTAAWDRFLRASRPRIGPGATRRLLGVERDPVLPGAPTGRYLRITFHVAVEDGAASETVVMAHTDSGWRVAMYYVRGAGPPPESGSRPSGAP
jgi:hypothetical protein